MPKLSELGMSLIATESPGSAWTELFSGGGRFGRMAGMFGVMCTLVVVSCSGGIISNIILKRNSEDCEHDIYITGEEIEEELRRVRRGGKGYMERMVRKSEDFIYGS